MKCTPGLVFLTSDAVRAFWKRLPLPGKIKRKTKQIFVGIFPPQCREEYFRMIAHSSSIHVKHDTVQNPDTFDNPEVDDHELALLEERMFEPAAAGMNPADRRRVLIIDWKHPTPDRDSGSYRMYKIIECLKNAGLEIDFIGDREAEHGGYKANLRQLCVNVLTGREEAIRHIHQHGMKYKSVWLVRPETFEKYAPLVRAFSPWARMVYDTVDLHWVRFHRGAELAIEDAARSLAYKANLYKRLELANARAADVSIAITKLEKEILLRENPELNVVVIPNIHEVATEIPTYGERSGLFFIGGFDHEPNVGAVLYFISELLPRIIVRIPDIMFYVVGSNMPKTIQALASEHVMPVGFVEDAIPYFNRCRVFVAPLLFGAGMKGKVGQSMGLGLPVVSTSIGAEGMGLVHHENVLIGDNAEDFAAAVVNLYTDPVLWEKLSKNGVDLITRNLSMEAISEQVLSLAK